MEDLQFINEIVNQSVKETSYYSVLISSGVFIVYTLITRLIDYYKHKDKEKPIMEMAKAIQEVSNNVVKLNTVLDKMIEDSHKRDFTKCKNTIELSFLGFEINLFHFCRDIILHNNIEANKNIIVTNISQKVNTEYYKVYSALSMYEIKDINVSSYLHSEWIENITNDCIDIIYNGQDKESRINQVGNKLKLSMDSFSMLVYNKTFN